MIGTHGINQNTVYQSNLSTKKIFVEKLFEFYTICIQDTIMNWIINNISWKLWTQDVWRNNKINVDCWWDRIFKTIDFHYLLVSVIHTQLIFNSFFFLQV